jgi:hypothetical protein
LWFIDWKVLLFIIIIFYLLIHFFIICIYSEIEFIKPFDDIKIQGKTITFTKDKYPRTIIAKLNKIKLYYLRIFIAFFQIIKRLRDVGVEIVKKNNPLKIKLYYHLLTKWLTQGLWGYLFYFFYNFYIYIFYFVSEVLCICIDDCDYYSMRNIFFYICNDFIFEFFSQLNLLKLKVVKFFHPN